MTTTNEDLAGWLDRCRIECREVNLVIRKGGREAHLTVDGSPVRVYANSMTPASAERVAEVGREAAQRLAGQIRERGAPDIKEFEQDVRRERGQLVIARALGEDTDQTRLALVVLSRALFRREIARALLLVAAGERQLAA